MFSNCTFYDARIDVVAPPRPLAPKAPPGPPGDDDDTDDDWDHRAVIRLLMGLVAVPEKAAAPAIPPAMGKAAKGKAVAPWKVAAPWKVVAPGKAAKANVGGPPPKRAMVPAKGAKVGGPPPKKAKAFIVAPGPPPKKANAFPAAPMILPPPPDIRQIPQFHGRMRVPTCWLAIPRDYDMREACRCRECAPGMHRAFQLFPH